MKEFVIKELRLKDFKGQTRVFTPNECKTIVKGCNGVGKTTLYKAFCWLLTGYTDAINGKNHELYDNRCEITKDTPKAIVYAKVMIDGCEYELERRAQAKFSRKRGSNEYVKDSSDSYTLLIDNIETSASDFNSFCERIIGSVDLLPYMLMGERFANLAIDDKAKARKILEQITGEVSVDDMEGDYVFIKDELSKYTIEQIKDRLKNQLKPYKQRIVELNALIDTKEDSLKAHDDSKYAELDTRIQEILSEIKNVDEVLLAKSKSLEPLVCKRNSIEREIQEMNVLIIKKEAEYDNACKDELRQIEDEISTLNKTNICNKNFNDSLDAELKKLESNLEILNAKRNELLKKRDEVKAMLFVGEKCPYCGQDLPFDELEKEKEKFNQRKNDELSIIVKEGTEIKRQIEETQQAIENNKTTLRAALISESVLREKYEKTKKLQLPFVLTSEYMELKGKLAELEANLPEIKIDNEELVEKKNALTEELQVASKEYGAKAFYDSIANEVEKLKEERFNTGCLIANIEKHLDEVFRYEEEKANIISDKINKLLNDCKIVMYSRQKDGELKPDCVIVNNDGVKYATLNNSARIRVCLSIQRMFCEHFRVNLPVFIDESSVFDTLSLPKFNSQMIYLFASDDRVLKVE